MRQRKAQRNLHNCEAGTIKYSRFVPRFVLAECANMLASWGVFSAHCWVLTSENQRVQLWFVLSLSAFEQNWIFQLRSAHWSLWPWLWENSFFFHVEVLEDDLGLWLLAGSLVLNPSRSHEKPSKPGVYVCKYYLHCVLVLGFVYISLYLVWKWWLQLDLLCSVCSLPVSRPGLIWLPAVLCFFSFWSPSWPRPSFLSFFLSPLSSDFLPRKRLTQCKFKRIALAFT